jgi:hypothetical protein
MPKQLTKVFYESKKAMANGKTVLATVTSTEIDELCAYPPPQTLAAWKSATDVAGHMSNRLVKTTKARGDTLLQVDRAYEAWINNPEAKGGIMHHGNAENLKTMLAQYMGKGITGSVQLSFLSTNYRNERNRGDVMTKVYRLVEVIHALDNEAQPDDEEKRKITRKMMLALLANMRVEWDWQSNALGGLSLIPGVNDVIGATGGDMAEEIAMAIQGGGAAVVGAGFGIVEATKGNVGNRVMIFLAEQATSFVRWAAEILKNLAGGDVATIIAVLNKAIKAVLLFVKKSAMGTLDSVTDIAEGLTGLIKDAWTRRNITVGAHELVTVDPAVALIRKGIVNGIAARQAVSGWKMVKGAISITVSATASSAAGKIADLVLGGFEFAFKMVYNFLESERIKKFQYEAVSMWKRLNGSDAPPPPPVAFAPPVLGRSKNTRDLKLKDNAAPKPPPRGFMIEFKAAGYTPEQFIGNSHGAFLNFMDSMIKSSPILAAVVINSGIVARADEVFHAATPRSTGDEELALKHIKLLQDEAKQIYSESGFKIIPATITDMTGTFRKTYESLLLNARMLPQNPKVVAP